MPAAAIVGACIERRQCSVSRVSTTLLPFYVAPNHSSITATLSTGPMAIRGSRTLRPQDTSVPHNRCRSLRRITGGAVSHRNCLGSKCPGFSSITALVSKCLVAEVSGNPILHVEVFRQPILNVAELFSAQDTLVFRHKYFTRQCMDTYEVWWDSL